MNLEGRLQRVERQVGTAGAAAGPYRRADKPPFDYTAFRELSEAMAREHPAHGVLRQQSAAEHGDDDDP